MPRRLGRKRQLILALVGLVALAATPFAQACGGDDPEPIDADEWTEELCSTVIDSVEEVQDLAEGFEGIDFDDGDEALERVLEVTDDIIDEYETLRANLEEIGEPDIEGGPEVVDATLAHADEVVDRGQDFREEVEDLDPDDSSFEDDLAEEFGDLESGGFREELEELEEDFDDVGEIIEAIDEDEECRAAVFSDVGELGPVVPAAEYAVNTCNELFVYDDFRNALETESFDLPVDDVARLSEDYLALVDEQIAETEVLLESLTAIGQPDVQGGDAVATALLTSLSDTIGLLHEFRDDTAAIEADDVPGYIEQADDLNFSFSGPDMMLAVQDLGTAGSDEVYGLFEDNGCDFYGVITPIYAPFAEEEPEPGPTEDASISDDDWIIAACRAEDYYFRLLSDELDRFDEAATLTDLAAAADQTVSSMDEATLASWDLGDFYVRSDVPGFEGGADYRLTWSLQMFEVGDAFDRAYSEALLIDSSTQESFDAGYAAVVPLKDAALAELDELLTETEDAPFNDLYPTYPECP